LADEIRRPLAVRERQSSSKSRAASFVPPKLRRTNKQLEPLADQLAAQAEVTERLRGSISAESEDERKEAVYEAIRHAQILDPTVSFAEGIRISVIPIRILLRERSGEPAGS